MDPSHEYPTPSASYQPHPRQSKATTQRQYREKEGERFSALRDVIKQLTGEVLQTRQDILRKAIDLLLYLLEMRRQEELEATEVNPSAPYEMPATGISNPADTSTSAHLAYPLQTHWPQPWQDAENVYHPAQDQAGRWQYHSMSDMDFAFEEQADDEEFGENWSQDSQV